MSFGTSSGQEASKTAQTAALPNLNSGTSNLASGANFFSTLLNGNEANTTAALQPDINRIREMNQGVVQGASTLMPRGGGRFATLFNQPFQANQQIGSLFNNVRSGAANNLAQIGGTQAQVGTANAQNLFQDALDQQKMKNQFIASMFQSATSPFKFSTGGA